MYVSLGFPEREKLDYDLISLCLQVYKLSIGAACGLSWPADRLVIQVLDDSTDPTVKVYILTHTYIYIDINIFVV